MHLKQHYGEQTTQAYSQNDRLQCSTGIAYRGTQCHADDQREKWMPESHVHRDSSISNRQHHYSNLYNIKLLNKTVDGFPVELRLEDVIGTINLVTIRS